MTDEDCCAKTKVVTQNDERQQSSKVAKNDDYDSFSQHDEL